MYIVYDSLWQFVASVNDRNITTLKFISLLWNCLTIYIITTVILTTRPKVLF